MRWEGAAETGSDQKFYPDAATDSQIQSFSLKFKGFVCDTSHSSPCNIKQRDEPPKCLT